MSRIACRIAGPYGICLNWDETEAWVNGKGEGTANLGNSMSIVDLKSFRASRDHGNTPFYLGGSASSAGGGTPRVPQAGFLSGRYLKRCLHPR